jgi:hypothetical protein
LNIKKTTTYDIRNPGPGLRQAHTRCRVIPVGRISKIPLDNWISSVNTDIKRKYIRKYVQIPPHILSQKMNENINMDNTMNARS